jgi:hypothetical protein
MGRALALFAAAAVYVGVMAGMKGIAVGPGAHGLFAAAHLVGKPVSCRAPRDRVPGSAPARTPTKM